MTARVSQIWLAFGLAAVSSILTITMPTETNNAIHITLTLLLVEHIIWMCQNYITKHAPI